MASSEKQEVRTPVLSFAIAIAQYVKLRIKIWWNIRKMTRSSSLVQRTLREFSVLFPAPFFIEIGANDGVVADPLRRHIIKNKWCGILVEPLNDVFAQLVRNYKQSPQLIFVEAAISDRDGRIKMYRIREEKFEWFPHLHALSSLSQEWLKNHTDRELVEEEVRMVSLPTLCKEHNVSHFNLLAIDTEGHDRQILDGIDLGVYKPEVILYEHVYQSDEERKSCRSRLSRHGYDTHEEGLDTICVRRPDASCEAPLHKLHEYFVALIANGQREARVKNLELT